MRVVPAAAVIALLSATPASAQEFFRIQGSIPANMQEGSCYPHGIPIGELTGLWNIRFSVVSTPHTANLRMSAYDTNGTFGAMSGWGGYLEIDSRLQRGPARTVYVCVGGEQADYTVYAHWIGGNERSVPTAFHWTQYDDELYGELIFNNADDPQGFATAQSSVLWNPSPQVYIRTGGPEGCSSTRRMHVETLHYWRAIVPVLAEQLTGVPYRHRVEVGCTNRPDRRDWIVVHYVTAAEYEAETGEEWGTAGARARLGSQYGRIWFRREEEHLGLTDWHRKSIAHELGHAFGLHHTRRTAHVMNADGTPPYPRGAVFSWREEDSARRAYAAGRGAQYCGDPAECGNGWFGFSPVLVERPVVVVVD